MNRSIHHISIYHKNCTGCRLCEISCSLVKTGNISRVQSRIQLVRYIENGAVYNTPTLCMNCCDPPCEKVCPTGATQRDPVTQLMVVDPDKCIGCKGCVFACPFGACFIDPDTDKAFRCDQCGGEPACVSICPEEAIVYHRDDEVSGSLKRGRLAHQPGKTKQFCTL